ncbi:MAG: hypothetical protein PHO01_00430 [Desulfotomaculaceae bacterium]|nr:hypothetical protein [Desulfotomaculaceae bacterium]
MGDLVLKIVKQETTPDDTQAQENLSTQAIVPTIDIYTAKFLFNITQKMVEEAVDRRVSILEKNIELRDQEIMRIMRRIQARMIMQQNKPKEPWWRKLFARTSDKKENIFDKKN